MYQLCVPCSRILPLHSRSAREALARTACKLHARNTFGYGMQTLRNAEQRHNHARPAYTWRFAYWHAFASSRVTPKARSRCTWQSYTRIDKSHSCRPGVIFPWPSHPIDVMPTVAEDSRALHPSRRLSPTKPMLVLNSSPLTANGVVQKRPSELQGMFFATPSHGALFCIFRTIWLIGMKS
jgi:hypothetical protein